MAYIFLDNYRYGLDGRRSELTSVPGTLISAINGHVNSGGEFEKRYGFPRTARPANTFGLESTDAGLITFGSIADPGGWPRGAVDGFQRLQHPTILLDGPTVYNPALHAMTAVRWSTAFRGKAFAAATFADGFTFLYYDGTPVISSYSGLYLSGFSGGITTTSTMATDLVYAGNHIGSNFKAASPAAGPFNFDTGNAQNHGSADSTVEFDSFTGTFTYVITKSVTSGQIAGVGSAPYAGIPATPATASFTVAGVLGKSYVVSAPANQQDPTPVGFTASNIYVNLNASVAWITNNNTTATAIATAINLLTSTTGYSAVAVGAVVTVSSPLPKGGNPNSLYVASTDATAAGNHAFSGASVADPALAQVTYISFDGTWAVGDYWKIVVAHSSVDYTLGRGDLGNGWWASGTVVAPSIGVTFSNRVYIGNGDIYNFSGIGDPTGFEEQTEGAGFIPYTSQYGSVDAVQSFAPYQGNLAVFGRRTIQVWHTDADPTDFAIVQTLSNIGTFAPFSVQSLGELDVFFLADTGIRSLRARDASNNAFVNDLGSPIDIFVQATLATLTDTQLASCCAVIEPTQNRYWIFIPNSNGSSGTIYVLSYFPSNKIVAWSQYTTTYVTGFTMSLVVSAGTGNVTITYGPAGIYTATALYNGDVQGTLAALAVIINAATGTTGYTCVSGATTITLTKTTGIAVNPTMTFAAALTATSVTTYVNTNFVPEKFVVHEGQVIASTSEGWYAYGGTDAVTYDNCLSTIQMPFIDFKKPGHDKKSTGFDAVLTGTWNFYGGPDWVSGNLETIALGVSQTTFDGGNVPFGAHGTHFTLKATNNKAEASKISSLLLYYNLEDSAND